MGIKYSKLVELIKEE